MTSSYEGYQRIKAQSLLMADVVELLLVTLSPESRAATVVMRLVRLIRRGFDVAETAASVHIDLTAGLREIEDLVRQMKAEGRSPTHIEWEALRLRIESAAASIRDA